MQTLDSISISIPSLLEALSSVPDFRSRHGRRYTLASILSLACAATLCGYSSYGAMAEWPKNYGSDLAEALGFHRGKTPSAGTLHTVFTCVDKAALERVLATWAEKVLQHLPESQKVAVPVSLDGKTLRGSLGQGAIETHLLSAVSHGLGLTLFQHGVPEKTNEIGAANAVLSALVLEGRIFTMDALLTQKEIAAQITGGGGTTLCPSRTTT